MLKPFDDEYMNQISSDLFVRGVLKKYHFESSQYTGLHLMAEKIKDCILLDEQSGTAGWTNATCQTKGLFAEREFHEIPVCITLGVGIDELQEQCLQQEYIMEGYMLETLASEMLLHSYARWNQNIRNEINRDVKRYHFLGSEPEYPIEMMPKILAELEAPVRCNTAYCMIPKKSVLFFAELAKPGEKAICEGICVNCKNVKCPNRMEEAKENEAAGRMPDRPSSYGISVIFGGRV